MKKNMTKVLSVILTVIFMMSGTLANIPEIPVTARAASITSDLYDDAAEQTDRISDIIELETLKRIADADNVSKAKKSDKLKIATAEDLTAGVYYNYLTGDEKLVYEAYCALNDTYRPFESYDSFQNLATSSGKVADNLAQYIESGQVVVVALSRSYTDSKEKSALFNNAVVAYSYDHCRNLKICLTSYSWVTTGQGSVAYIALTYKTVNESFDYTQWEKALDDAENEALSAIVFDPRYDDSNTAIKVFLVHEYLCSNVYYEYSKPERNTIQFWKNKFAYGAMVENKGVCIGIAKAAKLLLQHMDVDTYIPTSETHAWNMVYIDGEYYEFDATWDLAEGGDISYKYFNVTTNDLLTLDPSGAHIREAIAEKLPKATGTKYNYDYFRNMFGYGSDYNPEDDENPDYQQFNYDDEGPGEGEITPEVNGYVKNGVKYDLSNDGCAYVIGASGKKAKITIPESLEYTKDGETYEYLVISIESGAFSKNKNIKTVILGDYLMYINDKAFFKCSNLKNITFTGLQNLQQLGDNIFKGINKKAVFKISAYNKTEMNNIKIALKQCGTPAKAKFKRI